MNKTLEKIKSFAFIKAISAFIYSKYFPFLTAAVTLLCYYLGWDVVLIYYIGLCGIFILLFMDDVSPIISVLLFMSILVSLKNTPSNSMGDSDYYFRTANLVQIITVITLFISAAVARIALTVIQKRFTLTQIFYGLCGFAAVLLINGLFSKDYNPKNMLYGLIMASCFLGIYSAVKDNVKMDGEGYERIAYAFLALSVTLLIELIVAYITTDGIFVNGSVNRGLLIFGWGVYNTFGVMLVMCIPSVIFLAGKKNFGFVYTLYSFVLFIAAFMCFSRQAMVGAVAIYPFLMVMLFIKGKNRLANVCIFSAAAVAGIILFIIYFDNVINFFNEIFANIIVGGELNGSGRTRLWREALENFSTYPLLGKGFYVTFSYTGNSGLGFIPLMCHNTILQLMSCSGIIGLGAYLIHRTQTVLSFCRNINTERGFIAITILAMLIICLFDNHIFNIFPTIIYSALVAVLVQNEDKRTTA